MMRTLRLVAVAVALATTADLRAETPTWEYRQFHNPVIGATTHLAEIQTADVTVSVRCTEGYPHPETRVYMGDSLLGAFARVEWRFDDAPYHAARWTRSPNGQSLIVPATEGDEFLRLLKRYNQLDLKVIEADTREAELTVPLAGSAAAIARVADDCG